MSEHKCEGKVWTGWSYRPCGKTARYEHEGKWYCKTHHPPTVKAYEAARNAKWQAKWDAQEQARKEADEARAEMQRRAAAYDGLVAQRDALLEALKRMASIIDKMGDMPDGFIHPSPWQTLKCEEALTQARAAIKAVEGEKT